jgi:hypothetical protein
MIKVCGTSTVMIENIVVIESPHKFILHLCRYFKFWEVKQSVLVVTSRGVMFVPMGLFKKFQLVQKFKQDRHTQHVILTGLSCFHLEVSRLKVDSDTAD